MSSPEQTPESRVPLSLVLASIGGIIILTVLVIWALVPATMPRGVYRVVTAVLPDNTLPLPTPAAAANQPPLAPQPGGVIALLPETPIEEETLPETVVNIANVVTKDAQAGQPTRIVIPQLGLDAPVTESQLLRLQNGDQTYFQWQVPNGFMAGWHNNSALLGETGNTVLNGHHNIFGEVFGNLIDIEENAEIILYDNNRAYTYRVTDKWILPERDQPLEVRVANARWMAATDDERITLVTCWPYTDNSHRLIIVAKPVAATAGS
ncbi:MAG: sortase [Anaerolineae bacterium]